MSRNKSMLKEILEIRVSMCTFTVQYNTLHRQTIQVRFSIFFTGQPYILCTAKVNTVYICCTVRVCPGNACKRLFCTAYRQPVRSTYVIMCRTSRHIDIFTSYADELTLPIRYLYNYFTGRLVICRLAYTVLYRISLRKTPRGVYTGQRWEKLLWALIFKKSNFNKALGVGFFEK